MKKGKVNRVERERRKALAKAAYERRRRGERYQSLESKIVILLEQRSDVTRLMLPELLKKSLILIDSAMGSLRKKGFRIAPLNGPGTPMRIANTQTEVLKFINWRRNRFLPTSKRLIIAEHESGEQFKQLAPYPKQLLITLNEATKNSKSNGI